MTVPHIAKIKGGGAMHREKVSTPNEEKTGSNGFRWGGKRSPKRPRCGRGKNGHQRPESSRRGVGKKKKENAKGRVRGQESISEIHNNVVFRKGELAPKETPRK